VKLAAHLNSPPSSLMCMNAPRHEVDEAWGQPSLFSSVSVFVSVPIVPVALGPSHSNKQQRATVVGVAALSKQRGRQFIAHLILPSHNQSDCYKQNTAELCLAVPISAAHRVRHCRLARKRDNTCTASAEGFLHFSN
jgi:hypothetical protein